MVRLLGDYRMVSQSHPVPTVLLSDRYRLLELIGEGGSAQVFRAVDERLERPVAVKVLRPQFSDDAGMRARFGVEARAAAALSAPNIVPVYDFGTSADGALFIVMALVEGRSLRELLRQRGALTQREAARIGYGVALALSVAHGRGLVHRDVKPGNILLDADGVPRLTDFGIVKALSGATEITLPGVAFGTAAYLSPEQAMGGQVGPAADLYGLGTVLYEMITGSPPFAGPDAEEVRRQQASVPAPPPSVRVPAVDTHLEALIMSCLAKDPGGRPDSAAQVSATLATILGRLPAESAAGLATAPQVGAAGRPAVASQRAAWAGDAARAVPRGATALPSLSTTDFDDGRVDLDRTHAYRPGVVLGPRVGPRAGSMGARREAGAGPTPTWSRPSIVLVLLILIAGVVAVGAWLVADPGGRGVGGSAVGATASARQLPVVPVASNTAGTSATRAPLATESGLPPLATPVPTVAAVPTPTLTVLMPTSTLATPISTFLPVPLPTLRTAPTLLPTTGPTAPPGPTPTAQPTLQPTPRPIPRPTPSPTQEPTPEPTPRPTSSATASPTPPGPPIRQTTAVRPFRGGFNQRYHGRSAAWVYGQGTAFHTMTANFDIDGADSVRGDATLRLVGIDAEDIVKKPIRIILNGVIIYDGPDPLPNDFCCGPSGEGNWGTAEFGFSAALLGSSNSVSITNLDDRDCTYCPNFVMVDSAQVSYLARRE